MSVTTPPAPTLPWIPPQMPFGCPPGTPPSCFSELAALNACYNSVQMMEAILAKVMTDLVTNNKAVQDAIVAAIVASGSNVPLIGVTDGSNAQPGQVGEFISNQLSVNIPAAIQTIQVTALTIPAGDWDVWLSCEPLAHVNQLSFWLATIPPNTFISNPLVASLLEMVVDISGIATGAYARFSCNTTQPLILNFYSDATGQVAQTANLYAEARRRR
jgi:hypothetical protein